MNKIAACANPSRFKHLVGAHPKNWPAIHGTKRGHELGKLNSGLISFWIWIAGIWA